MWKVYCLVRNNSKRINQARIMRQDDIHIALACYQFARELEKIQMWYDNHEDFWKQTIRGRIMARVLYRAHWTISNMEDIL